MQRRSFLVRSIWAVCLLVGGLNHARILLQHGVLWDYGGVATASAVYWSSLTIFDPAVAASLFIRPKVGVVATAVLITTNVIHNLAVTAHTAAAEDVLARAADPLIGSQIAFMVFVLTTARFAWQGAGAGKQPEPGNTP